MYGSAPSQKGESKGWHGDKKKLRVSGVGCCFLLFVSIIAKS
jgi:hypothetical protein